MELDLAKLSSVQLVEQELSVRSESVCRKVKHQSQLKEDKKLLVSSYNEQIKQISEEIDTELGTIDKLNSHLLLLNNS